MLPACCRPVAHALPTCCRRVAGLLFAAQESAEPRIDVPHHGLHIRPVGPEPGAVDFHLLARLPRPGIGDLMLVEIPGEGLRFPFRERATDGELLDDAPEKADVAPLPCLGPSSASGCRCHRRMEPSRRRRVPRYNRTNSFSLLTTP